MTSPLLARQRAAQSCIDRFSGKPLRWGIAECAKLAAHSLHHMKIKVPFLKGAKYRSEAGAVKELRRLGFKGLIPAMDALGLQPIPPAMALPADIVAFEADGRLWDCALAVAVGNGRVLGFAEGVGAVVQPDWNMALAAWRVA